MEDYARKLMNWYSEFKRPLPWRDTTNPYKIWLSEIILQQTRVDQGLPYYKKFVSTFPKIKDLANADEQEVLKLWEGLGYYSRARNLHETSKHIVAHFNSEFPDNYNSLLKLKGVGPYTAAAIASIVFKECVAAIDGNVLRVVSRLFLIEEPVDKVKTQKAIRIILQDLIVKNNPGDFNQAMMELGAVICSPKNPQCSSCPVSVHCLAFAKQKQNTIPIKTGKIKVKEIYFNYLVPDSEGKTIINKRDLGIWIGLYQFPLIISHGRLLNKSEIKNEINGSGYSTITNLKPSPIIIHLLSHRKIKARFWSFKTVNFPGKVISKIIDKSELVNYPMPKLIVNYINLSFR